MKNTEVPKTKEGLQMEKVKWDKRPMFSKGGLSWWDKRNLKKHPEKSFLILMFFSNGTCKMFVVRTSSEMFVYKKKKYHLRYEDHYFNLTESQYMLCYHEDFPEPISREIHKKGDEAYFSINSENVAPLISMEYVKVLTTASNLNKYMKFLLLLSLIILVLTLIGWTQIRGLREILINTLTALATTVQ